MATGITKRHSRTCRSRSDGACNCQPSYEAWIYSKREGKKIRKSFARKSAAKSWRANAKSALDKGGLRAPTPTTLHEAWDAWYAGALADAIRNASGDTYKPSALRGYERHMRLRVLPAIGAMRLSDICRRDVQALADRLLANGLDPSTIRACFMPPRAVFRRAVDDEVIAANPCDGIRLPAVRSKRDRIVGVAEAEALLAAVPDRDRALWATAMFGGLRLGELQALRASDIDLAGGVIRVERGWDMKAGPVKPKTRAARRRVPIAGVLRDYLIEHRMATERSGDELVFGRTPDSPFDPSAVQR